MRKELHIIENVDKSSESFQTWLVECADKVGRAEKILAQRMSHERTLVALRGIFVAKPQPKQQNKEAK